MEDETPLFREKFRVTSARCPRWDYTSVGRYFVTVCTQGRRHWFGEISHGRMCLSDIGSMVWQCWDDIPQHHAHIALERCIVMPDHMHGIVRIVEPPRSKMDDACDIGETPHVSDVGHSPIEKDGAWEVVETPHGASLQRSGDKIMHWRRGVLGVVINQFKGACTKRIRPQCSDFAWQSRFHDRIIRDEDALGSINRYIDDNPAQWERDVGRTA